MTIVDPDRRLHDIYRMRDLSGRLLYIGVTNGGLRRFMEHSKDKTWWREVATIDVEHIHCSRTVIESIEREAIKDERPLYNVAHNTPPKELPAPVRTQTVGDWVGSDVTFTALVGMTDPSRPGVTAGQWKSMAGIPDRTFYRHRKALMDEGAVVNLGTDTEPRYAPSQFHLDDLIDGPPRPAPPIDPLTGRAALGGRVRRVDPFGFLSPTGGEG